MSTLDIDFLKNYYYFRIGFAASALLTSWAGSFLCVCVCVCVWRGGVLCILGSLAVSLASIH